MRWMVLLSLWCSVQFPPILLHQVVHCHDRIVSSHLQQGIYYHITHHLFTQHLASFFDTSPSVLRSTVSWDSLRLSRTSARFGLFCFMSKFISGDIATGRVMQRRKHRQHSNFSLCNAPDEHIIHILTCPSASEFRCSLTTQLHTRLVSSQTHPDIITFIIEGLQSWFFPSTQNHHLQFLQ